MRYVVRSLHQQTSVACTTGVQDVDMHKRCAQVVCFISGDVDQQTQITCCLNKLIDLSLKTISMLLKIAPISCLKHISLWNAIHMLIYASCIYCCIHLNRAEISNETRQWKALNWQCILSRQSRLEQELRFISKVCQVSTAPLMCRC